MKKNLVSFLIVFMVLLGGCAQRQRQNRPLIGLTSVFKTDTREDSRPTVSVGFAYVDVVLETGGLPVVLPAIRDRRAIRQYIDELDGLVLVGGADIPPHAYGQIPHETVRTMAEQRYDFESELIRLWLDRGKPILGICLGMQFTNVVAGGTLFQDIPSQVGTDIVHRGDHAMHKVKIEPESLLHEILNAEEALVYSAHHQAVKELGKNLKVIARSEDGVIEALQRTDGPFGLFVQWHPEAMTNAQHRRAIYAALIGACTTKN